MSPLQQETVARLRRVADMMAAHAILLKSCATRDRELQGFLADMEYITEIIRQLAAKGGAPDNTDGH